MKTIKLIHSPDPIFDKTPITDRLTKYLLKLRKNKLALEFIGGDQHSVNLGLEDLDALANDLSEGDCSHLGRSDTYSVARREFRIAAERSVRLDASEGERASAFKALDHGCAVG